MYKYALGGTAIGIMQIVDAGILYSNNGSCEGISLILSSVEFIWALISLVVIIRVKHLPTRWLAVAFFSYNLLSWLLAMFLATPSMPVIVPMWVVIFGGLFGLAYAASSIYIFKQPETLTSTSS